MPGHADRKPLPLNDTLKDLALLRASDVDLSSCLPDDNGATKDVDEEKEKTVARSYEFVREARAALRILNRGEVDNQVAKVDAIRGQLDEIMTGLSSEAEETR